MTSIPPVAKARLLAAIEEVARRLETDDCFPFERGDRALLSELELLSRECGFVRSPVQIEGKPESSIAILCIDYPALSIERASGAAGVAPEWIQLAVLSVERTPDGLTLPIKDAVERRQRSRAATKLRQWVYQLAQRPTIAGASVAPAPATAGSADAPADEGTGSEEFLPIGAFPKPIKARIELAARETTAGTRESMQVRRRLVAGSWRYSKVDVRRNWPSDARDLPES